MNKILFQLVLFKISHLIQSVSVTWLIELTAHGSDVSLSVFLTCLCNDRCRLYSDSDAAILKIGRVRVELGQVLKLVLGKNK